MRAALYARFSSDLQSTSSIEDQLVACRAFAGRMGAVVTAEFHDAAISGAAAVNRPGLGAMMAAAHAGAIDVVICEALDRLTRSGGDTWDIYDDLRALGVPIHTISEGHVQTMHVGLKGTMNALFLEELGAKTRRGQSGVAREGRHAGGAPAYGYRRLRRFDTAGEPLPGLLEIHTDAAEVVRSVFRDYAAGASPRAIAARLNAQGLPGPRGGLWNASTINGNAERGNGLLHNQLYAGIMVWGRHTWTKDRRTGSRRQRAAREDQQVRAEAPDLRIVDAELWRTVQDRVAAVSRASAGGTRPERARRPKRLLSGLVRCGCCHGPMIAGGPDGRYLCSARRERGPDACANGRSARADDLDARVIAAVRDQLLHPDVVEAAVREFHAEYQRLAGSRIRDRTRLDRDLAETTRRAERLVDQVADGFLSGPAVRDRLAALEARRADLEAQIAADDGQGQVVRLHPGTAGQYRRLVADLQTAIGDDVAAGGASVQVAQGAIAEDVRFQTRESARAALRALVTGVVITPQAERGKYLVDLEGDLAPLFQPKLEEGVRLSLGAGAGFEPATFRL